MNHDLSPVALAFGVLIGAYLIRSLERIVKALESRHPVYRPAGEWIDVSSALPVNDLRVMIDHGGEVEFAVFGGTDIDGTPYFRMKNGSIVRPQRWAFSPTALSK